MTFELGVYTFGNTPRPAGGGYGPTAHAIRDVQLLGHDRQILQMDVGGMPHATFLNAIELLGTEVLPQIRKELK